MTDDSNQYKDFYTKAKLDEAVDPKRQRERTIFESYRMKRADFDDFSQNYPSFNGLPFVVMVETSGLVHWTGHPSDRDLSKDMNDLLKEKLLFETEDWHDDPFKPQADSKEMEMAKELGYKANKLNELIDCLTEIHDKVHFVNKTLMDPKAMVDATKREDEQQVMFQGLKDLCVEIERAYLVLESEVRADIADDPKIPT